MIRPPWIPSGIKGLRASAATLHDEGMTVALPSHRRFECDFEAMYGMRVLQRQAKWCALLDAFTRIIGFVCGSVFIGAFCFGHFDLAVFSGALLMFALCMRAMILSGTQLADLLRLRNAFVAVRSEAARLTDRQYVQRLRELQMETCVTIWRWIAKSACAEVCRELGCADSIPVRPSHPDLPNASDRGGTARVSR
ncbi:MAG TPA: hypothetical protein VJM31_09415 [Vicinamibacterales bacterium]|nr:hypothetical protein [Vicinamibacterales bacterium]